MATRFHRTVRDLVNVPSDLVRIFLAEMLGTFLLVCIADGASAQALLARTLPDSIFHIAWAVGSAVGFGVYISFGVSGGHVNPSITVGVAAAGLIPWWKVPLYFAAQLTGALLAAFSVYGVYEASIDHYDGGIRQVLGPNGTAGIFSTYPQPYLPMTTGFCEQILNTALMLIPCFAILDPRNSKVASGLAPFLLGHVVFVVIISFGCNAGSPLNPARDLAGRIVCSAVGYDSTVWTGGRSCPEQWWIVGTISPLIGAAAGTWAYLLCVEYQHPIEKAALEGDKELDRKTEAPKMRSKEPTGSINAGCVVEEIGDSTMAAQTNNNVGKDDSRGSPKNDRSIRVTDDDDEEDIPNISVSSDAITVEHVVSDTNL